MNKDFTIIFEKMHDQAQGEVPEPEGGAAMISGENLIELDELAELRRVVAEITDPEPLSFTTT
jgi:hypothetical protein